MSDARTKAQNAALSAELAAVRARRAKACAEYEEATKDLYFTKEFNTALESVMHDRLASIGERFMAWVKRYSWGEYSLYAIGVDGWPKYQTDCERELGIDRRRISAVATYYRRRGYLRDEPKLLYPVVAPTLQVPDPNPKKSREYRTFYEEWKVTYSTDFQEEEVLRSALKAKTQVRLSLFKKWLQARTNAQTTLLETPQKQSEDPAGSSSATPFERDTARHKAKQAQPPTVEEGVQVKALLDARKYLFSEIAHMQQSYKNTTFANPPIDPECLEHQTLVNLILDRLQTYDEQEIVTYVQHVAFQFKGIGMAGKHVKPRAPGTPNGPDGLGLLVKWAEDWARLNGKPGKPAKGTKGAGNA